MTTVPTTITLTVDKKKVKIFSDWIPRWQFLVDWTEEWGNTDIIWKSTSYNDISVWVEVNKLMDKYPNQDAKKYKNVLLSDCWKTIQYMNPIGIDYLRFCIIDGRIGVNDRKRLYEQVGRSVRTAGIRYDYSGYDNYSEAGLHGNLSLWKDPVYGIIKPYGFDDELYVPFAAIDERIQQMILDADLNIVTGIIHTAY